MDVKTHHNLLEDGWVEISDDLMAPPRFTASVSGADLPYRVEMRLELRKGRFECVELTCHQKRGGPPVSGEGIRRLPVAGMIRRAILVTLQKTSGPSKTATPYLQEHQAGRDVAAQGPTDDALRFAAMVYRAAYLCQFDPTKAVMEAMGLTRPTAGRWVMKARERGFLKAAQRGKAGG